MKNTIPEPRRAGAPLSHNAPFPAVTPEKAGFPVPKSPHCEATVAPPASIPLLAELIGRGDGTFILRPRLPNQQLETWITVSEAAKIVGNVNPRRLYQFLGQYLVYRRPLPRRVVVSLKSVLAFRQATQDADFWENQELQERIIEDVQRQMEELARGSVGA